MISYVIPYHISNHINSTHMISYHIWYHITSYHISCHALYHISCHICHLMSYHNNAKSYIPYTIYHIYITAYTTPITISCSISYIIPCITSYIISHVIYHWPLKELVVWPTKVVWICSPHRNWIGVINVLRCRDCCGQHWQNGHYSPN